MSDPEKKTILKNNLKDLREARGLTQLEAGKILGVSHSAVCRHEVSSRGLTGPIVDEYAKLYKVPTVEIFVNLPTDENSEPTTA